MFTLMRTVRSHTADLHMRGVNSLCGNQVAKSQQHVTSLDSNTVTSCVIRSSHQCPLMQSACCRRLLGAAGVITMMSKGSTVNVVAACSTCVDPGCWPTVFASPTDPIVHPFVQLAIDYVTVLICGWQGFLNLYMGQMRNSSISAPMPLYVASGLLTYMQPEGEGILPAVWRGSYLQ